MWIFEKKVKMIVVLGVVGLMSPPFNSTLADDAASDPMAFARGAKAWANNCARCHQIRSPAEFRDDSWRAIITHMRVRAGLTGQDSRDILAFIQGSN